MLRILMPTFLIMLALNVNAIPEKHNYLYVANIDQTKKILSINVGDGVNAPGYLLVHAKGEPNSRRIKNIKNMAFYLLSKNDVEKLPMPTIKYGECYDGKTEKYIPYNDSILPATYCNSVYQFDRKKEKKHELIIWTTELDVKKIKMEELQFESKSKYEACEFVLKRTPNTKNTFSYKNNVCSFMINGQKGATYKAENIELKVNKRHSLKILFTKNFADTGMRIGPIVEKGIYIRSILEIIEGTAYSSGSSIDTNFSEVKYLLRIRNKRILLLGVNQLKIKYFKKFFFSVPLPGGESDNEFTLKKPFFTKVMFGNTLFYNK